MTWGSVAAGGTEQVLAAALFLLLIAIILFSAIALLLKRAELYKIYFPLIFSLGLLYSLLLPPLSAPDEVAHYVGAYELSNIILGSPEPVRDSEGRLMIRSEDVFIDDWQGDGDPDNATVIGRSLSSELYRELLSRGIFSTGETGYHFTLQEPVKTTRLAYLMPALGFCTARILGLGGFGLLYLGRLFNLLMFSILGTMAVRRTPIGKELFFAVSLFPMLLELIGSLSYDCFILGLSFYLSACILETGLEKERIDRWDIVRISAVAVLLSPCKIIYSLLFLACFIIPARKFPSKRAYIGTVLLIGLLIVSSIFISNFQSLRQYLLPSAEAVNSVDWVEGNVPAETYNLPEMLKSPIILLKILRNTVQIQGGYYLFTMAGGALGHLDEEIGLGIPLLYLVYGITLLINISGTEERRFSPGARLLCFAVPILSAALLLVSMLISYTPLRTDYVLGVQGRYFLPLLPMLLLSLSCPLPYYIARGGGRRALMAAGLIGRMLLLMLIIISSLLLPWIYLIISGRVFFPAA